VDAGLASLGSGDTGFWAQLKAAAIKIAPAPSIMRFIGTSIRRDVFGVTASMTTPTASLPEIASSVGMVAVANLSVKQGRCSTVLEHLAGQPNLAPDFIREAFFCGQRSLP